MTKINQHIKIVSSSKSTLSSMSHASRQAIFDILSRHFEAVSISLVDNIKDLNQVVDESPDLVFLGMKFIPSDPSLGLNDPNKIWVSDYLNSYGITATGSGGDAHFLDINKHYGKHAVAEAGPQTSPYFIAEQNSATDPTYDNDLTCPLFVKPSNRGGGLGIDRQSLVRNRDQLIQKINLIAENYQSDSLVEEFLPGREFSVAILRQPHTMQYKAMPIELVAEADEYGISLLAGDVKAANNEQVLSVDDPDLRSAICDLAIGAFKSIGGRDYGRIDIRLDSLDRPTFLEANLIPSLIDNYGSFPKSCALNLNMDHESAIMTMVRLAMMRQPSQEYTASSDARLSTFATPSL